MSAAFRHRSVQACGRAGARAATPVAAVACLLACTLCLAAGDATSEVDLIARMLHLGPESVVADVGAGDGKWSAELALRLGPKGRVYATEVEEEKLEEIRLRARNQDLSNVIAVLGGEEDSGLQESCCDAILLRMVYHHFTHPAEMRASLLRSLRPGGLLAVIDILPQKHWRRLEQVPDRGGHGVPPDEVVRELAAGGFELVSRFDSWNDDRDRFCLLFQRGADPAPPQ